MLWFAYCPMMFENVFFPLLSSWTSMQNMNLRQNTIDKKPHPNNIIVSDYCNLCAWLHFSPPYCTSNTLQQHNIDQCSANKPTPCNPQTLRKKVLLPGHGIEILAYMYPHNIPYMMWMCKRVDMPMWSILLVKTWEHIIYLFTTNFALKKLSKSRPQTISRYPNL